MKQGVPTDSLDGFDTTGVVDGDLLRYDDTSQVFVCFAPTDLIKDGTGITWAYNSVLGTLTPTVSLASFSTTNLGEGTNLYFTDERAQDAVGAALTDSTTIDFTYTDASGQITAIVIDDSISNAKLVNMAQATIKGRASGAGTGDPTDLTAAQVSTIVASAVATTLNVTSGTYTPTLTNSVNVTSSAASLCQYLRVGNTVTVSGSVDIFPTATADTQLGISLPVASNFAAIVDAAGTANCYTVQQSGGLYADATNNRMTLRFLANTTAGSAFQFTFTYRVI